MTIKFNENVLLSNKTYFGEKKIYKYFIGYTCLAESSLDSVFKKDENYYLKMFLKESKHSEKEEIRQVIEDLDISSDESNEE